MRVILAPNPLRDVGLAYAKSLCVALDGAGVGCEVIPLDQFDLPGFSLPSADGIVSIGGDGTILRVARVAAVQNLPILAVNFGKKGFIAQFEPEDLAEMVGLLAGEKLETQPRMMLDVALLRGNQEIHRDFALNDMVITGQTRLIDLVVCGDGQPIARFSGDGVIVSTPTGSTAYSLSAGGPIIEPWAHSITITPICPHGLVAKSFVLTPDRTVSVKVEMTDGKFAHLAVDGGDVLLKNGDEIRVTKSGYTARFVSNPKGSFYQTVYKKLGSDPL